MLKQGKLDYVEISKENKTLKNKSQGKILGLVTSINAYGLYSIRANNLNVYLCLLKVNQYEAITLVTHLNFSH